MKRVICLLSVMLLLLCGCGGELPYFVKDVDDLTDFHCYIAHDGDTTVLHDDDAKASYHLITEALRDMKEPDTSPSGKQIGMIFYVGDSNDPVADAVPFAQQYGDYMVAENGVGLYVASIESSSGHSYQVDPSVYTALLKMM